MLHSGKFWNLVFGRCFTVVCRSPLFKIRQQRKYIPNSFLYNLLFLTTHIHNTRNMGFVTLTYLVSIKHAICSCLKITVASRGVFTYSCAHTRKTCGKISAHFDLLSAK